MCFLILRLQFMLPVGHRNGYWDHHMWHHPHAPHRSLSLLFCFPSEEERQFTCADQLLWVRYVCLLEKSKNNHDTKFQSKWHIFLMLRQSKKSPAINEVKDNWSRITLSGKLSNIRFMCIYKSVFIINAKYLWVLKPILVKSQHKCVYACTNFQNGLTGTLWSPIRYIQWSSAVSEMRWPCDM